MSNLIEPQSKRDLFTFVVNRIEGEQPLQFLKATLPQGVLYMRSKIDMNNWVYYHIVLENEDDKMFVEDGFLTLDEFIEVVEEYGSTTLKGYGVSWSPIDADCEITGVIQ